MDLQEARIGQWRAAVLRGKSINETDADELEGHLREQITDLTAAGLTEDEAFLIAVKRLGEVDRLTAEFAREHGDRLWKQLAIVPPGASPRQSPWVMIGFALLAAAVLQIARVLAGTTDPNAMELFGIPTEAWFFRNGSLFVLPVLAAYFCVVRRVPWQRVVGLGSAIAVVALAINLFPFELGSTTDQLIWIHLPVVLWFAVGFAYLGGEFGSSGRRMDFIRFSGEWAIYYALIALGGIVLVALTVLILTPIAPDALESIYAWAVPSGAAGAVVVGAWLVEEKKSVIENLAPVLTVLFTPLFAIMLIIATVGYLAVGLGSEFDRDLVSVFDVLLLVVLGLVVYAISARDAMKRAGVMDIIRLVAVIAAIVLDILVLVSMLARVGEYGFTANRLAALGLNVILLVNLAGTAWLTIRMLSGRSTAVRLERWQTGYLPVFAVWVTFVVLAVPPLFQFA